MSSSKPEQRAEKLPALVFVRSGRSGASRKMESLVAWVQVTQKKRLRVVQLDADRCPEVAERLDVHKVPSLVLMKDSREIDRIEGRATGRQIDDLIKRHVA